VIAKAIEPPAAEIARHARNADLLAAISLAIGGRKSELKQALERRGIEWDGRSSDTLVAAIKEKAEQNFEAGAARVQAMKLWLGANR